MTYHPQFCVIVVYHFLQIEDLKAQLSIEKLNHTKLKSDGERESSTHKHEIKRLQHENKALTDNLESLKTQKSELSKDVEVSKVKLAELQARLADTQSDLTSHKEKEKVTPNITSAHFLNVCLNIKRSHLLLDFSRTTLAIQLSKEVGSVKQLSSIFQIVRTFYQFNLQVFIILTTMLRNRI